CCLVFNVAIKMHLLELMAGAGQRGAIGARCGASSPGLQAGVVDLLDDIEWSRGVFDPLPSGPKV
ncbi:hypothetical protein, partial [Streptosporangium canum]|uniref:hypothetical protein n=1 Tax=Streptosporangium canum TaxID=324952 RepID=UPI0033BC5412